MYHVAYESTCISHANDGYLKGSMTMIRKETLWLLTYLTYSAKKKTGRGKIDDDSGKIAKLNDVGFYCIAKNSERLIS